MSDPVTPPATDAPAPAPVSSLSAHVIAVIEAVARYALEMGAEIETLRADCDNAIAKVETEIAAKLAAAPAPQAGS